MAVTIWKPQKSPTPMDDEEYEKITDTHMVTGPVLLSMHQSLEDTWKINK